MTNVNTKPHAKPSLLQSLRFSRKNRLSLVMQNEASECGLACLTMIANYYGQAINLRELRHSMPASQQGMTLQQLIEYGNKLNLASRPLKLELNELKELQLPAILHWNFKHFVVLRKVSSKRIHILDPAIGEQTLSYDKTSQQFTGIALELIPNSQFEKSKESDKLSLWAFAKNKFGIKRQLASLLGLSLFIQAFALASPFYMQTVIDKVLLSNSHHLLTILALGFALLLCIESITQWLRDTIMLRFSNTFNLSISSGVFAHLLSLPSQYFQRRHIGDIVSRFSSLQHVRDILTQGLISAFIDGLFGIITLVVMVLYSVKLALIVLAVVFIYSLFRWLLFFPIKQLNQQILHSDAAQQSYFMQSVRAITTIKLANANEKTHANWLNKFIDNANQRIALGKWNIHFSIINKVLFGLENLVVVYLAAHLVMLNTFSIGMLFAFMSYKGRFVSATASLIDKWIEFKLLHVHLARLEDILFTKSEIPPDINQQLAHAKQQKVMEINQCGKHEKRGARIDISKLAFSYHKQQAPVFKNVNLHLEAGSFIAIEGKSGCGKTSFLNCMLGLNSPTNGKIFINQLELSPQNRHQFNMAAVMQNDQLLNGSVLDNISNFDDMVDLKKAVAAAETACIHQEIMAMTMQYETLVGDMGDSLSGGQKQRIILARAIYQTPTLLILDEATSHLDIQTEAQICRHLKAFPITILMVAHRPQALAAAEKVYTLSSHGLTENSYSSDNIQPSDNSKDTKLC